jgi:MFS-type transporter involved in bile tolerance (Atg22 family)
MQQTASIFASDKARGSAIRAWAMYDWANSAFATTTMAVGLVLANQIPASLISWLLGERVPA